MMQAAQNLKPGRMAALEIAGWAVPPDNSSLQIKKPRICMRG